ncbi:MAG: DUF3126 family protein [Sphingomonadales bacterium]
MKESEVVDVQAYLRGLFGTDRIRLKRGRAQDGMEMYVGDEFVGTVYRDDDECDVSYNVTMTVLYIDLRK